MIEMIHLFSDLVLHLPAHLAAFSADYGGWLYGLLFAIIFAETGFVVTPFLPGDSLLFAVGALCALGDGQGSAQGGSLSLSSVLPLLWFAAVAGDLTNYSIGKFMHAKFAQKRTLKFVKPEYLEKTQDFYRRHGGKTLMLSRFAPIIRTYAPFVAGLGLMPRSRFLTFSILGGGIWVSCFVLAGYYFGNLPQIQSNFHYVILGIVVISLAPVMLEAWKSRTARKSQASVGHQKTGVERV